VLSLILSSNNVALFLQDRLASANFPADWDSALTDVDKPAALATISITLLLQQQQQPYWLEPSAATLQRMCEVLQQLSRAVFGTPQQHITSSTAGTNTATSATTAVQLSINEQSSTAVGSIAGRSNSDSSSSDDCGAYSEQDKLILCDLLSSCLRVLHVNLYYMTR
jgi:hypothetical protein